MAGFVAHQHQRNYITTDNQNRFNTNPDTFISNFEVVVTNVKNKPGYAPLVAKKDFEIGEVRKFVCVKKKQED